MPGIMVFFMGLGVFALALFIINEIIRFILIGLDARNLVKRICVPSLVLFIVISIPFISGNTSEEQVRQKTADTPASPQEPPKQHTSIVVDSNGSSPCGFSNNDVHILAETGPRSIGVQIGEGVCDNKFDIHTKGTGQGVVIKGSPTNPLNAPPAIPTLKDKPAKTTPQTFLAPASR